MHKFHSKIKVSMIHFKLKISKTASIEYFNKEPVIFALYLCFTYTFLLPTHIYLRLTAWLPMHWYMCLVLIHTTEFLVLTKKFTNILLWNYIHYTYMYYWIFWLELKFTFILFPKPTLRLAKISLSSTNNFEAWKALYY